VAADGPEAVVGDSVVEVLAALVEVAAEAAAPVVVGKIMSMKEYVINVSKIEDLQTLNDKDELEKIFSRAQSTIVNGEKVLLVRKNKNGKSEKFDEMSTEDELAQYRKEVFRYVH
jgi:hypothetical protein